MRRNRAHCWPVEETHGDNLWTVSESLSRWVLQQTFLQHPVSRQSLNILNRREVGREPSWMTGLLMSFDACHDSLSSEGTEKSLRQFWDTHVRVCWLTSSRFVITVSQGYRNSRRRQSLELSRGWCWRWGNLEHLAEHLCFISLRLSPFSFPFWSLLPTKITLVWAVGLLSRLNVRAEVTTEVWQIDLTLGEGVPSPSQSFRNIILLKAPGKRFLF